MYAHWTDTSLHILAASLFPHALSHRFWNWFANDSVGSNSLIHPAIRSDGMRIFSMIQASAGWGIQSIIATSCHIRVHATHRSGSFYRKETNRSTPFVPLYRGGSGCAWITGLPWAAMAEGVHETCRNTAPQPSASPEMPQPLWGAMPRQ